MKIKDIQAYENWKANNTDPYGLAIFRYAERWANMMEERIANGEKIENIAETLSFKANEEGITGFMYGCAVKILSECWEYGEELRKWHNEKYDYIGDGVVNPAVLKINK
jgi:hypothetical protein